jgi:sugar/nucleoside kinase (ribokinase family)
MNRRGLIAGGNWLVDQIKLIDHWPEQDTLAGISEEMRGNGGSPFNLLIDLAKLGAPFPLEGVGLVGDDEYGRWIEDQCATHHIDIRQLRRSTAAPTSYTDVMTVAGSGRRTFFHRRGANALLAPGHFQLAGSRAKLFHLGYLLLLDSLDAPGPDGRPKSCAVLEAARRAGLYTSADLVSDVASRFADIVLPVLPCLDLLLVNDYEAACASRVPVRRGERLDPGAVERAARLLLEAGVRHWVVVHFPEGAYACGRNGQGIWQPALNLAPDHIKGAAGAGDAFGAGVLYGLHEDWSMPRCLNLGVAAAATSLSHPTCSEGVRPVADCLNLAESVGFRPLPGA